MGACEGMGAFHAENVRGGGGGGGGQKWTLKLLQG